MAATQRLHEALAHAPIEDTRSNFIGEQHRVASRTTALEEALYQDDPHLRRSYERYVVPSVPTVHDPSTSTASPAAEYMKIPAHMTGRAYRLASDEEAPPSVCVSAVCALLAGLYEKTPFSDGVAKRVGCCGMQEGKGVGCGGKVAHALRCPPRTAMGASAP